MKWGKCGYREQQLGNMEKLERENNKIVCSGRGRISFSVPNPYLLRQCQRTQLKSINTNPRAQHDRFLGRILSNFLTVPLRLSRWRVGRERQITIKYTNKVLIFFLSTKTCLYSQSFIIYFNISNIEEVFEKFSPTSRFEFFALFWNSKE